MLRHWLLLLVSGLSIGASQAATDTSSIYEEVESSVYQVRVTLELLDLDVIHDLAVVKSESNRGKPLEIAEVPDKGARLFSLGNPLDLGFSIVTGTNNGIMAQDEDGNILFSGSLNQGMSGGPTLDESGKVVGINVAADVIILNTKA